MRLDEYFQEAKDIILSHRILLDEGEAEDKCASDEEQSAYKKQFQFSDLDNAFKTELNKEWAQWHASCADKNIRAFLDDGLYPQTRDLLLGLSTHIRNIKLTNKNFMIDARNNKPFTQQGIINFCNAATGILEYGNVLQHYLAHTIAKNPEQSDYLKFLNKESVILNNLITTLNPFARIRNNEGHVSYDEFMQIYPDKTLLTNPIQTQTNNNPSNRST